VWWWCDGIYKRNGNWKYNDLFLLFLWLVARIFVLSGIWNLFQISGREKEYACLFLSPSFPTFFSTSFAHTSFFFLHNKFSFFVRQEWIG
jgi:hypothetical protein